MLNDDRGVPGARMRILRELQGSMHRLLGQLTLVPFQRSLHRLVRRSLVHPAIVSVPARGGQREPKEDQRNESYRIEGDAQTLQGGGMHPNAERVQHALRAGGSTADVVELTAAATTAAQAAEALGVTVGQIANSLVFVADGEPVLVLTSGANRVDTSKVARLLGKAQVSRAQPDVVRAATGFAIGGVAPVGHATELPVLIDEDLAQYDVIWAAGGTPHTVFRTTYAELTRLSGARPADVRRD